MARRNDTRSESERLVDRALHTSNTLSRTELDALWTIANSAMHAGVLHVAFAATEALLCQADLRDNVCADCLPNVAATKLGTLYPTAMLQSLIDRVESLNWHVASRLRCAG